MNVAPSAAMIAEQAFRSGESSRAISILLAHHTERDCHLRLREWAAACRRWDILQRLDPLTLAADDPERKVDQGLQQLMSGQPQEALLTLNQICASHPDLSSAHHHAAKALQNLGQSERALQRLTIALQLNPEYPEALFSRAHVLRAVGRLDEAVDGYQHVVSLIPDFAPALLNLGITLAALDRPQEALVFFENLLESSPDDIDALSNQGLCLHALGRWQQALHTYTRALTTHPEHGATHFYLGCLYNEQKQTDSARKHLDAALAINPEDVEAYVELIGLLEQTQQLELAMRQLTRALRIAPQHPGLHLEGMRLARRRGAMDEAQQHLKAIDPRGLSARQAQSYWFECGVLQDRLNNPQAAMSAFVRGNALAATSPRRHGIDREAFGRRNMHLQTWLRSAAAGAQRQESDPLFQARFRPAFLVGFPRSGTTLLDTMLDAHSDVVSIEERPTLELAIEEVLSAHGGYPDGLSRLDAAGVAALQSSYLKQAERWLHEGFSGLLLDKLPLRLLRVPLLHRLFPTAPIVFALRHPCDVVLSNFMQQYDPNEAFVHFDTLQDSAQLYAQVMTSWRLIVETLSIKPHYVRYESLIANPQAVLAETCAALELQMQPGMLDTQTRLAGRQPLRTNSYQQVAEPVYTRAVDRWRRYEAWLKPVLPILEPHIQWLGYSDP